MKQLAQESVRKLGSGVVVLAGEADGKAALAVAVSKDLVDRGVVRYVDGAWVRCAPEPATNFSGVGYFFARELRALLARLGVAVRAAR